MNIKKNIKKFGTDKMNTRAEILAFQLVHNRGYEEAMNFIKMKKDFFHEDVGLINLKKSIQIGIEDLKVSKEDITLLNNAQEIMDFLLDIELNIFKYNQDIFSEDEDS